MNSGHMTTHVVLCLPDSSSPWRCSLLDHEGTYHTPWIGQKGLDFPPNLPKILSIQRPQVLLQDFKSVMSSFNALTSPFPDNLCTHRNSSSEEELVSYLISSALSMVSAEGMNT